MFLGEMSMSLLGRKPTAERPPNGRRVMVLKISVLWLCMGVLFIRLIFNRIDFVTKKAQRTHEKESNKGGR